MSAHTKGPWRFDPDNLNVYCGGLLAQVYGHMHNGERAANAARIVACVNALEGIENPGTSIKGAGEMLREAAKQFRLLNQKGHAEMCDLHADALGVK